MQRRQRGRTAHRVHELLDLEKKSTTGIETSKLFVLINCFDGQVGATMDDVAHIDFVSEAKQTDGPYDILVTIESSSNDEAKKALDKIRQINTIRYTLTLRSSNDDGVLG